MKKLITILSLFLLSNTLQAQYSGGSGTEAEPYQIATLTDLMSLSNNTADFNKHFILTADVDASETAGWNDIMTDATILEGFKPIGTYSSSGNTSFRGIFDGRGHVITGLTINRPETGGVGLFGYIGTGGEVKNLGLIGGSVIGQALVGGLAGVNSGTISSCFATSSATGGFWTGGLVGQNAYGTIVNSYATGAVNSNNQQGFGGLVGSNYYGIISSSYAIGKVHRHYGGGLVGWNSGTITDCFWDIQASTTTNGANEQYCPAGVTGKTTAQMKQAATFASWDSNIWSIAEGLSYPYLQSSPLPFKLIINTSGPGSFSVSPEPINGGYAPGTVVTLTASPENSNILFKQWKNADVQTELTATVLMDTHKMVTAEFLDIIEIDSLETLAKIGNDPAYPLDGGYVLTADIDASETASWNDAGTDTEILEGFKPIGFSSYLDEYVFSGVFDGRGHTITGLTINIRPKVWEVGLFGCIGRGGQVRNLGLVDVRFAGGSSIGAVAGWSSGVINCCYSIGGIIEGDWAGGLVGGNSGTIINSYNVGTVNGGWPVGGLIGNSYGTIRNCYAAAVITGSSEVGGLVGWNEDSSIASCFWDTEASGIINGVGRGSVAGVTGKTTAQLQTQSTFDNPAAGWDFENIWKMHSHKASYPRLWYQVDIAGDIAGRDGVDLEDFSALANGWLADYDLEDLQILMQNWLVGVN